MQPNEEIHINLPNQPSGSYSFSNLRGITGVLHLKAYSASVLINKHKKKRKLDRYIILNGELRHRKPISAALHVSE